MIFIGAEQTLKQNHEQQFQEVLVAIDNVKSKVDTEEYNLTYRQLQNCMGNLGKNSLSTEEAKQILDAMGDEIEFDNALLNDFFNICGEGILDSYYRRKVLKKKDENIKFDEHLLPNFLNICEEWNLWILNLKHLYCSCSKSLFKSPYKKQINSKLNKTAKKLFQKLCEFDVSYNQKFNAVLDAIGNVKNETKGTEEYNLAYKQLKNCIKNFEGHSLPIEEVKKILEVMGKEVKFDYDLLFGFFSVCNIHILNEILVKQIFENAEDNLIIDKYLLDNCFIDVKDRSLSYDFVKWILSETFKTGDNLFSLNYLYNIFRVCQEEILDEDLVSQILLKLKCYCIDANFDDDVLIVFFRAYKGNSLRRENLEKICSVCDKSMFEHQKDVINSKLNNETSKKLFEDLCAFYEKDKKEKEEKKEEENLFEEKRQNKKLRIWGIAGIIFGGLIFLGAISFVTSWAIGFVALASVAVVKIAAPVAVVGLVPLILGICFTKKFEANKKTIELEEGKLDQSKAKERDAEEKSDNLPEPLEPLMKGSDKDSKKRNSYI